VVVFTGAAANIDLCWSLALPAVAIHFFPRAALDATKTFGLLCAYQ